MISPVAKSLPSPPLYPATIFGKHLRFQEQSPAIKELLSRVFVHFFKDPPPRDVPHWPSGQAMAVEARYNMRRFSGDDTLSRGRYYTLCRSELGESNQTLAMELLAYAAEFREEYFDVYDLFDPGWLGARDLLDDESKQIASTYEWRAIAIFEMPIEFDAKRLMRDRASELGRGRHFIVPY